MSEPELAADMIGFPNLISNVSHDNINKWTDDILQNFGTDKKNLINSILESVKNVAADVSNADIVNSFKDMQRRYVHVSLFASLSYMYITELLTSQQTTIKNYIQANTATIATLNTQLEASQQSAATVESLKKEIVTLTAQTESFRTLESDLQERAQELSTFIDGYATAVEAEGQGPNGGSKRKKRAQKGGFIRDGTRANLAGDPYPKAS